MTVKDIIKSAKIDDGTIEETVGTAANPVDFTYMTYGGGTVPWENTYQNSRGHAYIKSDGTTLWLLYSNSAVRELSMSTPWDMSTLTSVQGKNFTDCDAFFWKSDGTKFYITNNTAKKLEEYNVSTAWDISTAIINTSNYIDYGVTFGANPYAMGVHFKTDGTKVYLYGDASEELVEYDLSTAWDLSTASLNSTTTYTSFNTSPTSFYIRPDGAAIYAIDTIQDRAVQAALTTAWDSSTLGTISYFDMDNTLYGYADNYINALAFKSDGSEVYLFGTNTVFTGTLSVAWDLTTATFPSQPSSHVSFTQTSFALVNMAFKPDGTDFYVYASSRIIFQYSLSTPFDLTTATYVGQSGACDILSTVYQTSLQISPNGKHVILSYLPGSSASEVGTYTMSTPWDITTLNTTGSKLQNLSANLTTTGYILVVNKTGTKFYIVDTSRNCLTYTMSSPWDASTATYSGTTTMAQILYGGTFALNGTKFIGVNGLNVYEFDVPTAYDLSTATGSYVGSLTGQNNRYLDPNSFAIWHDAMWVFDAGTGVLIPYNFN